MKDPAFLFYSDNFQSGTQFFSDEQTGKYIRLLCAQHLHGHLSEKHMMFICKTYDLDIWSKFKKDGEGKFYNERLELEILRRKSYSESRSTNRKSVNKKKKHMKKTSKSYVNHMGIGDGDGIEIGNRSGNETLISPFSENFDRYWQGWKAYKKAEHGKTYKSVKTEASSLKLLYNLSEGDEGRAAKIIETSIANQWQGFFPLKNQTNGQHKHDDTSLKQKTADRFGGRKQA